jgi:hypothetical protein
MADTAPAIASAVSGKRIAVDIERPIAKRAIGHYSGFPGTFCLTTFRNRSSQRASKKPGSLERMASRMRW